MHPPCPVQWAPAKKVGAPVVRIEPSRWVGPEVKFLTEILELYERIGDNVE